MQKNRIRTPALLETSVAAQRIFAWFFAYPGQAFTLTDICKETMTAKTTASIIVTMMEGAGFIKKTVLGKLWRLMANTDSPHFRIRKAAFNFSELAHSTLVYDLRQKYPGARAIVLFGSVRKGEDVETSDIDVAVELPSATKNEVVPFGSTRIGYRKNVTVNLFIFSRKTVDLNVFANIANGIVLDGFLEVKL